jgi:exonuclease SbcC
LRSQRLDLARAHQKALLDKGNCLTAAGKAATGLQQAQARREQSGVALAAAEHRLAALAHAEPLVVEQAGLTERYQTLGREQTDLTVRRRKHMESKAMLTSDSEALATRQIEAGKLEATLAPMTQRVVTAQTAFSQALDGAADARTRRDALRSAEEARTVLIQAAATATRLLADRDTANALLAEKGLRIEELGTRVGQFTADAALATARKQEVAGLTTRYRADGESFQLLLKLASERKHLQPGAECPLCGGTDHPFVRDGRFGELDAHALARSRELQAQIEALQTEAMELESRLRQTSADLAAASTRRQSESDVAEQVAATLQTLTAELQRALAVLSLPDVAQANEINERAVGLAAAKIQAEHLLQALNDAEAELTAAVDAVQKANAQLNNLRAEMAASHAALVERTAGLQVSTREMDALGQRLLERRVDLAKEFAIYGIERVDADGQPDLAKALAEVVRLAGEVVGAQAGMLTAKTAGQEAHAAVDTAAVTQEAARAALTKAEAVQAEQSSQLATLDGQIGQVLGGQDPDEVQRRLESALATAAAALLKIDEAIRVADNQWVAARTEHAQGRERIVALAEELRVRQDELASGLRSLGLADGPELQARLLDASTLRELQAIRSRLTDALTTANALHGARQSERDRHFAIRLESIDVAAISSDAAAAVAELDARAQQDMATLAGHKLRLQQTDDNREKRDLLRGDVKDKDAQHKLWVRLHGLIGVSGGQAFQKFAQILNMEELAGKANHHLALLSPRYALVGAGAGGEPRLDFAVRDTYQAGEVRPLTTLSGGETFLVSLSLALALADYRSVRMPVETLLLDEGFGTLDPSTLKVAIGALKALNASGGAQVGIISHVEALKDEIQARVIVESQGNGRSTVRLEMGM